MADIKVVCGDCGKEMTISEYVDREQAVCFACGGKLDVPNIELSAPKPLTTVRKRKPDEAEVARHEEAQEHASQSAKAYKKKERKRRPKRAHVRKDAPGWLAFFVVGGLLGYLRWYHASPVDMDSFRTYGYIALGVLHLVIILEAFKDDAFQGLLCVAIPVYPYAYLFLRCDSFLLRAVAAGLLIGFGYDTAMVLGDQFLYWTDKLQARIMEGA